jgi:alkanesulfonate monooxygenase SsuD/methylene tetrahydromethanopterin reductase-like flavin-dependent oxidoreductase (luciferase family)
MTAVHDERQPGRVTGTAVALRDPLPWERFAELARRVESLGYRAVFLPEIAGRDAFAALTALAGETSSVLLGTGIVPMTSRVPRLTAMGAATVNERSGGRAILGIGTGPARKGALDELAAQVGHIRALIGDQSVSLPDEDLEALSLRSPSAVPVWLAGLGPRSMRLAGRIADGVLLNWCSPERVAQARLDIRAAAVDAGRDADDVTVAVYVRACVDQDDPVAALDAAKAAAGEYASYPAYARQFSLMGLGAHAEAAAAAHRAGRPEDVPDELVRAICLVGDAAAVRGRLDAYRDAGADLPVVYPMLVPGSVPGDSIMATIRGLAPAVG